MNTSELDKILQKLSHDRMQTYIKYQKQDKIEALDLYLWNNQISGALLFPLQICEVIVRNSISNVLEIVYNKNGQLWLQNQGFIRSLPKKTGQYQPDVDISKAIGKVKGELLTISKVIPELNFVFWQSMMTKRHDNPVWKKHFYTAFPNANKENTIANNRNEIHDNLDSIRKLRNRIAHHEPIFQRDLLIEYQLIIKIIDYCCHDVARWVEQNQQVITLIKAKP